VKRSAWSIPVMLIVCAVAPANGQHAAPLTADQALATLKAGNEHYVAGRLDHPHANAARMHELAAGQHPCAAVLSCADSRVPPEIVFDQGLGDLFTIRVAGNVAGDTEIASIEYAAEHLDVPLVIVLGHQKCGAVTAAVEAGEAPGHLPSLVNAIRPAVEKTKGMSGDRVANAVRANVQLVVAELRASQPILAERIAKHELRVAGAVYSLDTGRVEWLPQPAPTSR